MVTTQDTHNIYFRYREITLDKFYLACFYQMNATNSGNILNALQNYTGPASVFEDVVQSECNLVCVLQEHPSEGRAR